MCLLRISIKSIVCPFHKIETHVCLVQHILCSLFLSHSVDMRERCRAFKVSMSVPCSVRTKWVNEWIVHAKFCTTIIVAISWFSVSIHETHRDTSSHNKHSEKKRANSSEFTSECKRVAVQVLPPNRAHRAIDRTNKFNLCLLIFICDIKINENRIIFTCR